MAKILAFVARRVPRLYPTIHMFTCIYCDRMYPETRGEHWPYCSQECDRRSMRMYLE